MGEFLQHDNTDRKLHLTLYQIMRVNYFPAKIGNKSRMSAFTILIQYNVEVLASAVRKKKK